MLKQERQLVILKEIRENQRVISSELSKQLKVSEDTIRRDLKELSDTGKINKVHGGAVLSGESYLPFSYEDREAYGKDEKQIIAQKAIQLLEDNQVIFIDGGTTNLAITKNLPLELKATFITNCLPVANILANYKNIQTIFLGGRIIGSAKVTVGLEVAQMIRQVRADLFFLGTRSIDSKLGVSDINHDEVNIKRLMAESSKRVIALATSDKLGNVQPFIIQEIGQIDLLITELDTDNSLLNAFGDESIQLL